MRRESDGCHYLPIGIMVHCSLGISYNQKNISTRIKIFIAQNGTDLAVLVLHEITFLQLDGLADVPGDLPGHVPAVLGGNSPADSSGNFAAPLLTNRLALLLGDTLAALPLKW